MKKIIYILLIGFLLGVVFFIGMNQAFIATSTNESCEMCHVHPHATKSWKLSVHHNSKSGVITNCVDCHLPPKGGCSHVMAKARLGLHDLWHYMVKDSADFDWESKKSMEYAPKIVFNNSCEKCHTNLFPFRLQDKGVAAHLHYQNNKEKLGLQCISCHLDVGHFDPNYKNQSMGVMEMEIEDTTIFTAPAQITKFENFVETIPNTPVTVSMKAIPGGEFMMGSPENEKFRAADEGPQRKVKLKPFFMSEYEVTWNQFWAFYKETMALNREPYEKVMAINRDPNVDAVSGPTAPYGAPDQGWGAGDRPAITMTHYSAEIFCLWLSKKTGKKYRLPTEAEWEYAARGGTTTPYFFEGKPGKFSNKGFMKSIFKADTAVINTYVIYENNSRGKTQKPSSVKANPFGLKNMLGNVMEYCADKYDPEAYSKMPEESSNPAPCMEGEEFVVRGGGFNQDASLMRSAARSHTHHEEWIKTDPQQPQSIWWYTDCKSIGFRVVCEYEE